MLILCNHNLCRSPFAAAALRVCIDSRRAHELVVESAGYMAAGKACPAPVVRAAFRHGVDLSQHRARYVDHQLVSRADLIIVMDGSQQAAIRVRYGRSTPPVVWLGDLSVHATENRAIPDPIGGDWAVIDAVFERVLRCVDVLSVSLTHPGRSENARASGA